MKPVLPFPKLKNCVNTMERVTITVTGWMNQESHNPVHYRALFHLTQLTRAVGGFALAIQRGDKEEAQRALFLIRGAVENAEEAFGISQEKVD